MIWTKIHDTAKPVGLAIGFIGFGMWIQSAHDGAASIPWFHQQAALARKLQTVDLPKEKAHAECEHRLANTTKTLLVKSENGADVDDKTLPDCPEPKK